MAIKRINLSIQIQKWKEARKGKEVRAANVEAFEKIEEVVNEAVDGVNQASADVSGAMNAANATILRSNEVLNQATNRANETMDRADVVLDDATTYAGVTQSWAVGGTNTRPGEDNDNSRYYSLQSKTEAQRAEDAAARAEQYAGFVVPIFTVNFVTGNLDYPTTENIIFIINRVTGKLDYALA